MNAQEIWYHTEEFLKSPTGGDSHVLLYFSQGKYDELIKADPVLAGQLEERKKLVTSGIEFVATMGLLALLKHVEIELIEMPPPGATLQ